VPLHRLRLRNTGYYCRWLCRLQNEDGAADTYIFIGGFIVCKTIDSAAVTYIQVVLSSVKLKVALVLHTSTVSLYRWLCLLQNKDGAADTYLFIGGSAVAASSAGGEGGSGPATTGDGHCYWTLYRWLCCLQNKDGAADTYLFIGGSVVAASSAGGEGGSGPATTGDGHCYWTL
jgi:hypothetical protein